MRNELRKPWQRMALSLSGILVIAGMWRWATFHLYTLPEHSIVAFTSLTNNSFYVIGSIVVFMVTGKLFFDWKNTTASSVIQHTITDKKEVTRVDPKDLDDESVK